ncbi:ABC transporter ATP-binding protein [Verrucomicrobiaceae bacterium N1E253]|uniref:ABC transporter ATP-binding protein n=1 Tax=Oceaniferula marina TaxID=2748318 RepID=A0A851GPD5_9BACT|nr:ABC transporter ATP-binding protein [Oceaniferula marina]NWK56985.1 ABC transporter ATP-binding protein [Oceaniferula marina]
MEETPAVQINHLVKEFPSPFRKSKVRAVNDVSLNIMPGEVYGLIGPNGSGKSTTMKALLGLLTPTAGSCFVFGKNSLKTDSRQDIGFLPENPYFYKHLNGEETLRFYAKLCGLRGKQLHQRVDEMLEMVSLEDARHRRIGGYSKGMLQRIGLAQALIHKPRLVILDEPTAGVDPIGSRMIRDLIVDLKQQGVTIFLCSHLLEQVQEVCDQVGIIFHGKLVKEGKLNDLIAIENQTEILIQNADAETLERIRGMIEQQGSAQLLNIGKPRTTLERLFLDEAEKSQSSIHTSSKEPTEKGASDA